MPGGLLTDRGKRATALLYAQHVTHGVFGRPTWADLFNPPNEDFFASGVGDELGRAPISAVRYVIPDPTGPITYKNPNGTTDGPYRYATQAEIDAAAADPLGPLAPSSYIEFEFVLPENVADGQAIGEVALAMDSVTTTPGWATPAQVTAPGHLLYLSTIPAKPIEPDEEIVRRVLIKA